MVEETVAVKKQSHMVNTSKLTQGVDTTPKEHYFWTGNNLEDSKSKLEGNLWNDVKRQKRRSEISLLLESKRIKQDDGVEATSRIVGEEELFDWNKYLKETSSKYVPKQFFCHLVPECMCGFEPGMKLEVPNPDYKNAYWLGTIIARAPPLILVRYTGFQEINNADFWCNTMSDDIHPIGWCSKNKKQLRPPKAIQNKEKNWYNYLIKHLTGATKASESLFLRKSHPAHYLRTGQYLEVVDTYNPTCYWLAKITEVFSGRLFLQYEGCEDSKQGFWCYYLNENLRPVGYGLENDLTLCPPNGSSPGSIKHNGFSRITDRLLALSKRPDAAIFKSLFVGWQKKVEHNLLLGMKLEAVHPKDPTLICVASVMRIFDAFYFLVKIDNLLSTEDDLVTNSFIAHNGSPNIFPVGFCSKNGLVLNQPRGYNGKFTWDGYLKYTKSLGVPEVFFQERSARVDLLEVGMKLEAVDKENPAHVCVSTITRIIGTHVWLHIDGDTKSDQIFHVDSPDLFPVGWCEAIGHELQWPRPNTLEQKNRISSLRHNESRKKRLEVLRKGKLRKENLASEDQAKPSKRQTRKDKVKRYGRRGVSRKRIVYEDNVDDGSITDTSVAIVCINRLAEEYNSEDSIKEYFRLDSKGRLPKEVVTIDDDDDDDYDNNNLSKTTTVAEKSKYSEVDLSYFSFLKVKPKGLTSEEDEIFKRKMKENDGNQGRLQDHVLTAAGRENRRSLNSVVAMLRASRRHGRSHLTQLEQYKQNKEKSKNTSDSSSHENSTIKPFHTENESKQVINLCNDEDDNEAISAPDTTFLDQSGSINIPGKGEYKIVEKIVTKEGEKNKIILKLGKQMQSVNSTSSQSNNIVTMPTTLVDDMYTLQNMARRHPGVDELMRHRFSTVRTFCKDLPKNPLQWTNKHVVSFVKNADMAKYAKAFYDQDIDGHSFLLLTVQEIHHILGVLLGPAMKLHDYIFTLQQLVNDAYITKHDNDSGSYLRETDSIVLERASTFSRLKDKHENSLEVTNTVSQNKPIIQPPDVCSFRTVAQWMDDSVLMKQSRQKVDLKNNNETKKLSDYRVEETPLFNVNNVHNGAHCGHTSPATQSCSAANQTIKFISSNDYNFIPVSSLKPLHQPGAFTFAQPFQMIQLQPQAMQIGSEFPVQLNSQFLPVHYIANQGEDTKSSFNFVKQGSLQTSSMARFIIPQTAGTNRSADVLCSTQETNNNNSNEKILPRIKSEHVGIPVGKSKLVAGVSSGIRNEYEFQASQSIPDFPDIVSTTMLPEETSTLQKTFSEHPYYEQFLANVKLELGSRDLWDKFFNLGTEMILTRLGRRMFPNLQVTATGMVPTAKYVVLVNFAPADHYRYKYEYEISKWQIACEETTPSPKHVYVHPASPALGGDWMKSTIDFTKCKLTNNSTDRKGHILMHSMHKYQPRIQIIHWDGSIPLHGYSTDLLKLGCRREFLFNETKFIAVTAYQNSQITQLKIQSNPFARGFRGDWKKISVADETKSKKQKKNDILDDDDQNDDDELNSDSHHEDDDSSQSYVV